MENKTNNEMEEKIIQDEEVVEKIHDELLNTKNYEELNDKIEKIINTVEKLNQKEKIEIEIVKPKPKKFIYYDPEDID